MHKCFVMDQHMRILCNTSENHVQHMQAKYTPDLKCQSTRLNVLRDESTCMAYIAHSISLKRKAIVLQRIGYDWLWSTSGILWIDYRGALCKSCHVLVVSCAYTLYLPT